MQWQKIMELYARVEETFSHESYAHSTGWHLKKKVRVISTVLLFFALCEHLTSWASFLNDRLVQIRMCNWNYGSYFYYLATTHLRQIFAELPVNPFTVLWAEYMNITFSFAWNFIDLFIIVMSISIASKFNKINQRLEFYRERVDAKS